MNSLNVKNINSYNEKVFKTLSLGRKLFREVQTSIDAESKKPLLKKERFHLKRCL